MSVSKELLTDILDGITVVQQYLQDLSREKLSHGSELQRQTSLKTIQGIMKKIQHSHPSIRPRVNTPGGMKKPPAPPPPAGAPPLPTIQDSGTTEDDGELYEEPPPSTNADVPESVAEDYLSFEPVHGANGGANGVEDETQEMYEAMETQEEQDVYEEPVTNPGGSLDAEQGENYEDPVVSRPSTASLHSQDSGAEYAETSIFKSGGDGAFDVSMDWGNVYTMPSKGEKVKASALKNILIKGYLEKLGGRNHKTWQRRYCVLSGALMYFYEKEASRTYNNCIALQAFTTSAADNLTNAKKNHFAFKMTQQDKNTGKNKDYYFRTGSEDVRGKWLKCIGKVVSGSQSPNTASRQSSSSTLPRHMPSQVSASTFLDTPTNRKRASSLQELEEEGELYEDMAIPEEPEDQDEYVAVSPTPDQPVDGGLDSSEEYVDVVPQNEIEQEEYEDTSNFQQPPPPLSPPPGPPSDVFFSPPPVISPQPVAAPKAPIPAPKAPAPPPPTEPEVDTSKVYSQRTDNGISLEKVFVSLWDFAASEEDELGLTRGDLVYVNSPQDTAEWWFGELLDPDASRKMGKVGFFPRNYSTSAFTAP